MDLERDLLYWCLIEIKAQGARAKGTLHRSALQNLLLHLPGFGGVPYMANL